MDVEAVKETRSRLLQIAIIQIKWEPFHNSFISRICDGLSGQRFSRLLALGLSLLLRLGIGLRLGLVLVLRLVLRLEKRKLITVTSYFSRLRKTCYNDYTLHGQETNHVIIVITYQKMIHVTIYTRQLACR